MQRSAAFFVLIPYTYLTHKERWLLVHLNTQLHLTVQHLPVFCLPNVYTFLIMDSTKVNLAKAFGYHSEALAVVFAVLYIPLLAYFVLMAFKRPTYVHNAMVIFCSCKKQTVYIDICISSANSSPTSYSTDRRVYSPSRPNCRSIGGTKTGPTNCGPNFVWSWICGPVVFCLYTGAGYVSPHQILS